MAVDTQVAPSKSLHKSLYSLTKFYLTIGFARNGNLLHKKYPHNNNKKIIAYIMINIYYDKNKFMVMVDGVQNSSGKIEIASGKSVSLIIFPTFEKTLFIPISAWLHTKTDSINCSIPNIKLSNQDFYLTPKFTPYIPPAPPNVAMQREFGEHTITIYTDSLPKMLIENKSTFINVILPEMPDKLQEAVMENGILFYCLCKNYLCVVFYDYNDYKILIDKDCDSYSFDEEGINFSINLHDNQGRIYHAHLAFDGTEYTCDKDSFDYENLHTPHEKLLGFDFLQAIMAEDLDYISRLLAPNAKIDLEQTCTSLDGIEDFLVPSIPTFDSNVFVFCGKAVKKCTFFTQNGLICGVNIV